MKNYNIYRNLKDDLRNKKIKLANLKKKITEIKVEVETLKVEIEENINGLNMVFDNIITQKK